MKRKVSSKIKYYLNVWLAVLRHSLSKAGTYRIEVLVRSLRGIFLVVIQVIFINAVMGNQDHFAGWTLDEMYLLAGIFNAVNYVSWSLFSINLWRLEEKVMKGEFDFLLLKPFSSIFGASFTEFFVDDAMSAISGLLLVGYYVIKHFAELTILNVGASLIMIICAFFIWFSFELIFASFDFIAIKNGTREIKKQIVGIGKFPVDIWEGKILFYTLLPIAFVGTVPAQALLGNLDWKYIVMGIAISVLFLFIAKVIWNQCLKRYTGAGG